MTQVRRATAIGDDRSPTVTASTCSFCGVAGESAEHLVVALSGVAIRAACVDLAHGLIKGRPAG